MSDPKENARRVANSHQCHDAAVCYMTSQRRRLQKKKTQKSDHIEAGATVSELFEILKIKWKEEQGEEMRQTMNSFRGN